MNTIFKYILVVAPITAIMFFYVAHQQKAMDVKIDKNQAQFDKDWYRWESEFEKDKKKKEDLLAESKIFGEKMKELEKKEEEVVGKNDEMLDDMDLAMEESEKELEEKLKMEKEIAKEKGNVIRIR